MILLLMAMIDIYRNEAMITKEKRYYKIDHFYLMGEDLEHVTLAFDLKTSSPAVVYAALSRMSYFDKVVPMLQLRKSHFLTLANVTLYECKKKHLFFGHIFFMIFYSVNMKC